jgi:hypothetical protein
MSSRHQNSVGNEVGSRLYPSQDGEVATIGDETGIGVAETLSGSTKTGLPYTNNLSFVSNF